MSITRRSAVSGQSAASSVRIAATRSSVEVPDGQAYECSSITDPPRSRAQRADPPSSRWNSVTESRTRSRVTPVNDGARRVDVALAEQPGHDVGLAARQRRDPPRQPRGGGDELGGRGHEVARGRDVGGDDEVAGVPGGLALDVDGPPVRAVGPQRHRPRRPC